jgi:hypothetical protein
MAFFLNAFCVFNAASVQDVRVLGSFDTNMHVNFTKNSIVSTAFWKRSCIPYREGKVDNRNGHNRYFRIPHAIKSELRKPINLNIFESFTDGRSSQGGVLVLNKHLVDFSILLAGHSKADIYALLFTNENGVAINGMGHTYDFGGRCAEGYSLWRCEGPLNGGCEATVCSCGVGLSVG